MTREEAESRIMDLLIQIKEIAEEYYPHDSYINLTYHDGFYSFNNQHWEHAGEGVLRKNVFIQKGGENE